MSDYDFEGAYRLDWMSDDQWECYQMLADLYRGFHHIVGKLKPYGYGIALSTPFTNYFASFDYNNLTRAVFMAHDRMIRFEIEPSGPGRFKLVLHKRHTREGRMFERHPTIEQALADYREIYPLETVLK